MFSPLRNRFGIPGVISVIALVFAMLGGAYAANNSSGGGKATASAKAKKGPKGPKGATGPAGPAGPAGPQGPAGANGKDGANGTNGSNGSPGAAGAAGKSVTSTSFEGTDEPAGEPCVGAGGNSFKVEGSATTNYACNGTDGTDGEPWTAGGTLPEGATETGAWYISDAQKGESFELLETPISFNIPLASSLAEEDVHYVKKGDPIPAACENIGHTGAASAENPEATSGNLCIYEGAVGQGTFIFTYAPSDGASAGADPFGAILGFAPGVSKLAEGSGSWAVTG